MANSLNSLKAEGNLPEPSAIMPEGLRFSPVTKNDIPRLRDFFAMHPSRSCDYSLGGILMWVEYFSYQYAVDSDSLFIKGVDPVTQKAVYYQPLGPVSPAKAMALMLRDAEKSGRNALFVSPFESDYEKYTAELADAPELKDAWKEYLYRIEQFTGFRGKKMEKKRNHLNYFEKHYPGFSVEKLTAGNAPEIVEFTHRFEEGHKDSELFNYESSKTLESILDYELYPYDGLLIRNAEGKVIGYTFGEKIGDTFLVHVEKGDYQYNGVYQALASYLAREVAEKYPDVNFLNREEDMGDPALRKSKESYHPAAIINKRVRSVVLFN